MFFKSLLLKNFKSYENTRIDFSDGVTIVVGDNGAGKSSIFEGISFALFKDSKANIDNLIRRNNSGESYKMSVRLEFEVDGTVYRVTRNRENSQSSSFLEREIDGEYYQVCERDSLVNEEIRRILDMDSVLFKNAIYIQQGQIAELLNHNKSKREQIIGKLLGVSSLETAWEKLPLLQKKYEIEKISLSTRIEDLDIIKEEYDEKLEDCCELKKELKIITEELDQLEEELKTKNCEKELLDNEKRDFEEIQHKITTNTELIEEYANSIDKLNVSLEDIKSSEELIKELEPSVEKLVDYKDFYEVGKSLDQLGVDCEREQDIGKQIHDYKSILDETKESYDEYLVLEDRLKEYLEKEVDVKERVNEWNNLERDAFQKIGEIEDCKGKLKLAADDVKDKIANIRYKSNIAGCGVTRGRYEGWKRREYDFKFIFYQPRALCDDFKRSIGEGVDELEKALQRNNEEMRVLEHENSVCEDVLEELEGLDNQCPVCKSDIDDVQKEKLIEDNRSVISKNTMRYDDLIEFNKEYKERLDKWDCSLKDIEKVIEVISANEHLYGTMEKLKDDISNINTEMNTYGDLRGTYEQLKSFIDESNKRQEELKEEYEKYEKTQILLEQYNETQTHNTIQTLKTEIHKQKNTKTKIEEKHPELQNITTLKTEITTLEKNNQKYNQLKGQISNKEQLEEQVKNKQKENNEKQEENQKLNEQLNKNTYNTETYKKLNTSIIELNTKRENLKIKETQHQTNKQTLTTQIQTLKTEITTLEKEKTKLKNLNEFLEFTNKIRSFYHRDGIQSELRKNALPEIQRYTKEFFEQFNFNYTDLKITDDYEIILSDSEGNTDLNMASGGEEIGISLALRLGIAQTIAKGKIETILLDEPTIHLDEYRREELINIIKESIIIPQMIIVTHDNELEAAASNIIKVHKENGISQIGD